MEEYSEEIWLAGQLILNETSPFHKLSIYLTLCLVYTCAYANFCVSKSGGSLSLAGTIL